MKNVLIGGIVCLATLIGALGASASEPCYTYKLVTCYENVTVWVCKDVTYSKTVVKYDPCGKPYYAQVLCTKTIEVPEKKIVAVNKLVKVYN